MAARLRGLSQGSNGRGSIKRAPSFCGIYDFKPSPGCVPRHPKNVVLSPVNNFSQNGPLARSVQDTVIMLQVLSGWDARDVNALRQPPRDYISATGLGVAGPSASVGVLTLVGFQ